MVPRVQPFFPLVAAVIIAGGGIFTAWYFAVDIQKRVAEKQLYSQMIVAEWNQEWMDYRWRVERNEVVRPPTPLRQRLVDAGVIEERKKR